jgi:hypothetical protein
MESCGLTFDISGQPKAGPLDGMVGRHRGQKSWAPPIGNDFSRGRQVRGTRTCTKAAAKLAERSGVTRAGAVKDAAAAQQTDCQAQHCGAERHQLTS